MIGRGIFRPGVTLMAIITGVLMLAPVDSVFAQESSVTNIPVQGHGRGATRFTGTLDITEFVEQNGKVAAVGLLSGTLVDKGGNTIGEVVDQMVTVPVRNLQATCEILRLTLGPVDLEILGLRIQLNQIRLLITADPTGGLLGQLLCALAGALGPGGTLELVLGFLNDILGAILGALD